VPSSDPRYHGPMPKANEVGLRKRLAAREPKILTAIGE
jgi:hypothetical protein